MIDTPAILVVDDEPKIRELLASYAKAGGYRALCAVDGRDALAIFERERVDIILLDLMLPDMAGEDVCAAVRRVSEVPIIIISAKVDEQSVIRGLKTGADDYVCKPFSPRQVLARIEAVLRRSGGRDKKILSYKDLRLDTEAHTATMEGRPLSLTRDEYRILELFLTRQAKIFTRDEILDAVKGEGEGGFDRSVDSMVKRLRAKLGDSPRDSHYIATIYGMGYRLGDAAN